MSDSSKINKNKHDAVTTDPSENNSLTQKLKYKKNKTKYFRPHPEIQHIDPQNIKTI